MIQILEKILVLKGNINFFKNRIYINSGKDKIEYKRYMSKNNRNE